MSIPLVMSVIVVFLEILALVLCVCNYCLYIDHNNCLFILITSFWTAQFFWFSMCVNSGNYVWKLVLGLFVCEFPLTMLCWLARETWLLITAELLLNWLRYRLIELCTLKSLREIRSRALLIQGGLNGCKAVFVLTLGFEFFFSESSWRCLSLCNFFNTFLHCLDDIVQCRASVAFNVVIVQTYLMERWKQNLVSAFKEKPVSVFVCVF